MVFWRESSRVAPPKLETVPLTYLWVLQFNRLDSKSKKNRQGCWNFLARQKHSTGMAHFEVFVVNDIFHHELKPPLLKFLKNRLTFSLKDWIILLFIFRKNRLVGTETARAGTRQRPVILICSRPGKWIMQVRSELKAILVAFAASLLVVLHHPICGLKADRTADLRDVLIKFRLGVAIKYSTIGRQWTAGGAISRSFTWISYDQCLRLGYRKRTVPETNCPKRFAK